MLFKIQSLTKYLQFSFPTVAYGINFAHTTRLKKLKIRI